jgi:hypothetical protein
MDQPPQKPADPKKSMQIAPEQLRALADPNSSSYLRLLPAEIVKLVEQYAYNNLAQIIHAIRTAYLKDLLYQMLLLGYPAANKRLVDAFKDKVPSLKLPEDINLTDEEVVAILLNTPASFDLIKGNVTKFSPHEAAATAISPKKIATLFMIYAKQAQLNYQEAAEYARHLLLNMQSIKMWDSRKYTKESFELTVMNFLMAEYAQVLNANPSILPEIQVLVDMGASNIISRVISYGSDTNADWAYLYTQLKNRLGEKPEIAVCTSLALLLTHALQNKDHLKVETILNSIFYIAVLDQRFADCFAGKLKEQLGASLVDYLMESDEHSLPFDRSLWPHFIEILWNHAIKSSGVTAQKIVRLLLCFNLNIGWHTPQKLSFAYPVDAMREQAAQLKKIFNQFLMDVIRKGVANENNVILLLNHGADYNQVDAQGVTLLMHAIQKSEIGLVRILLEEKDINSKACDKQGRNALWYARNLETDMGTRLAIIELLQAAGVTEEEACVIQ